MLPNPDDTVKSVPVVILINDINPVVMAWAMGVINRTFTPTSKRDSCVHITSHSKVDKNYANALMSDIQQILFDHYENPPFNIHLDNKGYLELTFKRS